MAEGFGQLAGGVLLEASPLHLHKLVEGVVLWLWLPVHVCSSPLRSVHRFSAIRPGVWKGRSRNLVLCPASLVGCYSRGMGKRRIERHSSFREKVSREAYRDVR